MTKLVQNDIASLTNEQSALAALNANYALLEAFSDTVLSRDGTTPNQMSADLDMNSNQILNIGDPLNMLGNRITGLDFAVASDEPVTLGQLQALTAQSFTAAPGLTGYVLYNAGAGIIGADAGLTYDPALDTLTIGGDLVVSSGARIGFTGAATDDTLAVGDSTFRMDNVTVGFPELIFDTGDGLFYTRSSNTFVFEIGATGKLGLNATELRPSTSGGLTLGTSALPWGNIFHASASIIDFGAGNVQIAHGSNVIQYNYSGSGTLNLVNASSNMGVEIGRTNGGASTPFIDFHAGATAVDYDARIICTNGTGTAGRGGLSVDVGSFFPATDGLSLLGLSTNRWNGLHLAAGSAINWANGGITIGEASDQLLFIGASVNYQFDNQIIATLGGGTANSQPTITATNGTFSVTFIPKVAGGSFNGLATTNDGLVLALGSAIDVGVLTLAAHSSNTTGFRIGSKDVFHAGTFAFTSDISPSQITSDQNNYSPTGLDNATVLRLNTDASRVITGLTGGADGRLVLIHNIGAQNITLADESGSSTAANRFALTAATILTPDTCAMLQYDSTSSRWRMVGGTGGGSAASTPTKQYLLSGTGATYTTPANCRAIDAYIIGGGGGGGGGASSSNSGTTGTTSTFNSVNAVGGTGGQRASLGGVGGTGGTGGSGTATQRIPGSAGATGATNGGGSGGAGFDGSGNGTGGTFNSTAGSAAGANTGAGGGGGGANGQAGGGGGGSGERFFLMISSPSATYTYTVGGGGAGAATGGGTAGGTGGSGIIIVTEYY